jgi:hypothetical protein
MEPLSAHGDPLKSILVRQELVGQDRLQEGLVLLSWFDRAMESPGT